MRFVRVAAALAGLLLAPLVPASGYAQFEGPTASSASAGASPRTPAVSAGASPPTPAVSAGAQSPTLPEVTPSSAASKPPAGAASPAPTGAFEFDHATTWDLDVEGAFGRYFGSTDRWTGLVRARGGVLFVRDPVYDSIGISFEYSTLSKATFGVQVEVSRIDAGFWAQAGALLDTTARPGALLAGGWSLFGVEGQVRSYAGLGLGVTVFAKVSVPIGVVAHVLSNRSKIGSP